jgi:RimJ/RimL family protein N-acetyltransferase
MFETERLIIRRFTLEDANSVYECCNDYEVIKTTLGLPWPYTKKIAESWISKLSEREEIGTSYEFAICFKENPNKVIGCISLMDINNNAKRAEMGYWVGRKYWKQGIATEAAKFMINYGFEFLGLNSIIARYFDINPASGKVMQKCGMKFVGIIREHEFRFDKYYNVGYYEILKADKRN